MRKTSALRWIVLALLLAGYCAAGLSRIGFNVDILKMLPTHLRQVEGLSLFLKHFSQPNELMITLEAADSDSAEAAATALADHLRTRPDLIRRVVDRPPWEAPGTGIAEFLAFSLLNQPPEKIAALTARLAPGQIAATLADAKERLADSLDGQEIALLSYDPLGFTQALDFSRFAQSGAKSEFTSRDGTFRVIYLESAWTLRHYKDNIAWLAEVRRVCDAWRTGREITLGFTGEPAFVADISGSMDWDMSSSGAITLTVIAIIFWLCYRRAKPLFYLQAMLVLIFVLSLATAGLVLRELTVMGVGFGAIMIGLSVDYGYFVYQRARGHTGTVRQLQWQCLQNVMWTAGTTAAAFIALNVSSLPGLSQLGSLVAIGVVIGACIMLGIFAPIAMRVRVLETQPTLVDRFFASRKATAFSAWIVAALVVALLMGLWIKGTPHLDFSANVLRPRTSGAYAALDRVYEKLADDRDFLSVIVKGASSAEVLARLRDTEQRLDAARARGDLRAATTAPPLWPDAERQQINLPTLAALVPDTVRLREAVLAAGFNEQAFGLAEGILTQLAQWRAASFPVWPANDSSRWLMRRAASHASGNFLALGVIQPAAGRDQAISAAVESDGVYVTSWKLLGSQLAHVIPAEFARVTIGLVAIVLLLLWIALRRLRDVLLFAATTALVFAALAGAMSLLGLSWNLFNLAAILLLLGTGTDYSILMLLHLRREHDVPAAHRSLGLVIFLCASSSAAGFATLSWANNLGLASLGATCALGLTIDALISVFLLPHAWRALNRRS